MSKIIQMSGGDVEKPKIERTIEMMSLRGGTAGGRVHWTRRPDPGHGDVEEQGWSNKGDKG
jgi:hypothetical protein